MNTTLNILRSPTTTLETKRSIFDQLKRQYYNDEITYEQLEVYIELLYGTRHRKFGDLPAIQPIKVPSLLEDLDVPEDLTDSSDLYIQAFDLYQRSIIGYDELKNPPRHSGSNQSAHDKRSASRKRNPVLRSSVMYIHNDGDNYPNIFIMDQSSIESWLDNFNLDDLVAPTPVGCRAHG